MLSFLVGVWMSLLPRSWWRSWQPESTLHFRWAAMASGVLQFLVFLFATASLYVSYVARHAGAYAGAGRLAGLVALVFSTLEFLLYPHHLLLGYLMVEGMVRTGAAFIADEILPSFPLWLAVRWQQRASAKAAEAAMGLRVSDTVERVEGLPYDLRISSCRPKERWNDKLLTITYEDQFYEVLREERGPRPRQFIYLLRKAPESKVIRGHHYYRPDEPLEPQS